MNKINLMKELSKKQYYATLIESIIEEGASVNDIHNVVQVAETVNCDHIWSIPRLALIPKDVKGEFREVFIFKDYDNYLLKVINIILNERLGHLVSNNVFSYKSGVSVKDACIHLKDNLKVSNLNYVKTDISKYFNSVKSFAIEEMLESLIEDKEGLYLLKNLFKINRYVNLSGEIKEQYLGIMPGTATSSFFANYLLNKVDSTIADEVSIYARYSDDIIMIDSDIDKLNNSLDLLKDNLKHYNLLLNSNKTFVMQDVDNVEFLGLKVTKDSIDLSDKNFRKMKRFIKTTCNRYRKEYEIASKSKDVDIFIYMQNAIRTINTYMYGGYLNDKVAQKNSKLIYQFRNITTTETLKKLDFYINDSLRYIYTGKHNKANYKRVTIDLLEQLGVYSNVRLYNLYKLNKDMFKLRIHLLLNQDGLKQKYSFADGVVKSNNTIVEICKPDLYSAINTLVMNNLKIVIGQYMYSPDAIYVDFINKKIYLNELVIAKGNKLLIDSIYCTDGNSIYKVNIKDRYVDTFVIDEEELAHRYRNCYVNNNENKLYRKRNSYKYFPSILNKDFLLNGFKYDKEYNDQTLFTLQFYIYLYNISEIEYLKQREYNMVGDIIPVVYESRLIPTTE